MAQRTGRTARAITGIRITWRLTAKRPLGAEYGAWATRFELNDCAPRCAGAGLPFGGAVTQRPRQTLCIIVYPVRHPIVGVGNAPPIVTSTSNLWAKYGPGGVNTDRADVIATSVRKPATPWRCQGGAGAVSFCAKAANRAGAKWGACVAANAAAPVLAAQGAISCCTAF